jgi:hypothetical protein
MNISLASCCISKAINEVHGFRIEVLEHIANPRSPFLILHDNKGMILESYKNALKEDKIGVTRLWLDSIIANKKLKKIKCEADNYESAQVEVLKNSFSRRDLIIDDTEVIEKYHDFIQSYRINVIEADQASDFFHSSSNPLVFSYECLTTHLITQLALMVSRKKDLKLEDIHNGELAHSLESFGYSCLDQTRRGTSPSKKGSGELDLLIKNQNGAPISIIEALREKSCGSQNSNIAKHLNKLLNNYDTCGFKLNYIIVYCEQKNFGVFWNNYFSYVSDINNRADFSNDTPLISLDDTKDVLSTYTEIRVARAVHMRNNLEVEVLHIVCNMHV